jgi:nucleoside-diphosphate-sugar epimerase
VRGEPREVRVSRVLLTGATGFLGVHCRRELALRGFEVHTVGVRPASPASDNHHQLDLLDEEGQRRLLADLRPTHLLHLAWAKKPGGAVFNAIENYDWLSASLRLARLFAEHGGRRLVFCGTSAEYDWSYGYCTEHLTPTVPETTYGSCKHALRVAVEALARDTQLSWSWPRVFFCYGPHEPIQRLIPTVVASLLRGEQARCSHGLQMRGYLHVNDVARALAQLVECDVQGPVNVCSGTPIELRSIVTRIGELMGRPELIALGAIPARKNDHLVVFGNNHRLRAEVGWQPQVSLDDGLRDTIAWWRRELLGSEGTP